MARVHLLLVYAGMPPTGSVTGDVMSVVPLGQSVSAGVPRAG